MAATSARRENRFARLASSATSVCTATRRRRSDLALSPSRHRDEERVDGSEVLLHQIVRKLETPHPSAGMPDGMEQRSRRSAELSKGKTPWARISTSRSLAAAQPGSAQRAH